MSYGMDDVVVEGDTDIMHFSKHSNKRLKENENPKWNKVRRCNRLSDKYLVKGNFLKHYWNQSAVVCIHIGTCWWTQ